MTKQVEIFEGVFLALALVVTSCMTAQLTPVLAAGPESAQTKESENFNPRGPLLEQMKDGESFINEMFKDTEKLNDYQLVFQTKTFKKGSTVVERGNLYVKKPKMMRLEETGEFNKGAIAVIGKDGKARARGGGLAGLITLTLKPDDKMLDAANGDRMEDSDFLSLVTLLKERLKQGNIARVSEKPVTVGGVGEPAYVLELYTAADPKLCLKRIFVHPRTNLPLRWDDYDYKDPCLSTWTNIKTNVGLSDDLFKLE